MLLLEGGVCVGGGAKSKKGIYGIFHKFDDLIFLNVTNCSIPLQQL